MKSIKYYVMVLAIGFVSCQQAEKAPMSISMAIGQCDVSGAQSSIVRIDTATYVLTRDSVADEEKDTIYSVSLPVTLHLDGDGSELIVCQLVEAVEMYRVQIYADRLVGIYQLVFWPILFLIIRVEFQLYHHIAQ